MGFLDDLKKNLGFGEKAKQHDQPWTDQQEAADQAADQAADLAEAAPTEAPATVSELVVEAGDTLSGIAVQFGVDLDSLIAANADTVPNPDVIYPGQVLRLP